jgi:hypothetical protein
MPEQLDPTMKRQSGGKRIMIESPLIDEIVSEAVAKARHESIIEVLWSRFGAVPSELGDRIRSVQDKDGLARLTRSAATCRDLEAFSQSLRILLRPGQDDALRGLDQSNHAIESVLDSKHAAPEVRRLVRNFHEALTQQLDQRHWPWHARTHVTGITYLCDEKRAFVVFSVGKQFLSVGFFTGDQTIDGLEKGNWMGVRKNAGSETYRVHDAESLQRAVVYAVKAYEIATGRNLASTFI